MLDQRVLNYVYRVTHKNTKKRKHGRRGREWAKPNHADDLKKG
jgi:hypothetical protein